MKREITTEKMKLKEERNQFKNEMEQMNKENR